MDIYEKKLRRGNYFIKILMILTTLMFANQYYQSQVFDLGEFASLIAILAFLRGLMLSPLMLNSPMKSWVKKSNNFSKESYVYFFIAFLSLTYITSHEILLLQYVDSPLRFLQYCIPKSQGKMLLNTLNCTSLYKLFVFNSILP